MKFRNQTRNLDVVLRVFILSVSFGSVPAFVAHISDGDAGIAWFLQAAELPTSMKVYLAVLMLTLLMATGLADRLSGKSASRWIGFGYSLVNSAGRALPALLQVLSGAMLTVACLLSWNHQTGDFMGPAAYWSIWLFFFSVAVGTEWLVQYSLDFQREKARHLLAAG